MLYYGQIFKRIVFADFTVHVYINLLGILSYHVLNRIFRMYNHTHTWADCDMIVCRSKDIPYKHLFIRD